MIWLRAAIVALIGLAILAPNLPLRPVKTVVLLDQSPSARDQLWKIAPQLTLPGAKYIAFASTTSEVSSATARRLDLGEGTDAAEALGKARDLHPDQIVLVSDGLFQSQASLGIPVYSLYITPSANLSLSLVPPALPSRGETIEVRALIESTAKTKAKLVLDGPAGQVVRQLEVEPGRTSLGYRFRLEQPSVVRARVESPLGTKEARAEVTPSESTRVWVLGDRATAAYLKAQGYAVETPKRIEVPIRAEVVVLGVGAQDLSAGELDELGPFFYPGGGFLLEATPKGVFFFALGGRQPAHDLPGGTPGKTRGGGAGRGAP